MDIPPATADDGEKTKATLSMSDVIKAVEDLVRDALQKGRPRRTEEWEAVALYKDAEDSTARTAAMLGACLSSWESYVQSLGNSLQQDGPISMHDFVRGLIHHAFLRKRRADYRAQQMAEQIDRANVRGPDGEQIPFDPPAPDEPEELLKKVAEEIADLLRDQSVRDRLVLGLHLDGNTYEAIVKEVQTALPNERISISTVSRIVERFTDGLRARLEKD
jgi:hypothetical protein